MSRVFLVLLTMVIGSLSYALPVEFDPQAFEGTYFVPTKTGLLTGTNTIDLDPGLHAVVIGVNQFNITVAVDGTVTSANTDAVLTAGNQVIFNNTFINLNVPADFTGSYTMYQLDVGWKSGSGFYILVPGLQYRISIGNADLVDFTVDGSGAIVSSTNDTALNYSGNNLSFNLTDITVDPRSYTGQWAVGRITNRIVGLHNIRLVPNLDYLLILGTDGVATFKVDADGNIDNTSKPNSIDFAGNTLIFKNNFIEVDPNSGAADWYIMWVTSTFSTTEDVVVVPGFNYRLYNSTGFMTVVLDTTFDDSSFNVSNAGGTYTITKKSTVIPNMTTNLVANDFNSTLGNVEIDISGATLSSNIGDFSYENLGVAVALSANDFESNSLVVSGGLIEGRNSLVIQGKDNQGVDYLTGGVYWAGSAQVKVTTSIETTVNLTITIEENGEDRSFTVSKATSSMVAIFNNVPGGAGVITTSTGRSQKSLQVESGQKYSVNVKN